MIRRYWRYRCGKVEEERKKKKLEVTRKERRKRVRDDNLPESQLCVVCRVNPIEVS